MGTNCAPLIAYLFLNCYESEFMAKLHKDPSKELFDRASKRDVKGQIWPIFKTRQYL